MMEFNFTLHHVPGKDKEAADALSRNPVSKLSNEDLLLLHETEVENARVFQMQAKLVNMTLRLSKVKEAADFDLQYQKLKELLIKEGFPQHKRDLDEDLHEFWDSKDGLSVSEDGFVLNGTRLLIPKSMRIMILRELHSSHRGTSLTRQRARCAVYWPRIDADIGQVCDNCRECDPGRKANPKEPIVHHEAPTRPFEEISADWADIKGKKFLIIAENYSGFVQAAGPTEHPNEDYVIKALTEFFVDYAVPDKLFSDGGPPFPSHAVQQFLKDWNIEWVPSSADYPQSNSRAEFGVKSAKRLLEKCFNGRKLDTLKYAKGITQLRNTPHAGTDLSPALILYGQQIQDGLPVHKTSFAKDWSEKMRQFDRIRKELAEESEKAYNEHARKLKELDIGDEVLVHDNTKKKWSRRGVVMKRDLKLRRYWIGMPSGFVINRNRVHLKKACGIDIMKDAPAHVPTTTLPNTRNRQANDIPDESDQGKVDQAEVDEEEVEPEPEPNEPVREAAAEDEIQEDEPPQQPIELRRSQRPRKKSRRLIEED